MSKFVIVERMLDLQKIEQDLVSAIKERNQLRADVLRALKTRVQNEQINKGKPLGDEEILQLVQSEVKRRREAANMYRDAGRAELAEKENAEIDVLSVYLPAQVSEADIGTYIDQMIAKDQLTVQDFGKAMGALKQHFGNTAEGQILSKILKEKLK